MLKVSRILNSSQNLRDLAEDFLQKNLMDKVEGKCADVAKAFSKFLHAQGIPSKIIDARDYKGPLQSVGKSNHVLTAVGGIFVDFTAKQFSGSAEPIVIDKVSSLKKDWGVVNSYSSYQDFLTNFSKTQR